jgi:hypothetical protein
VGGVAALVAGVLLKLFGGTVSARVARMLERRRTDCGPEG